MPTALVTGATGFIGQPLCTALLARDYRVKIAVRSRRQGHPLDKRLVLYPADLDNSDDDVWRRAMRGVDTLVHLAAQVHDRHPGDAQVFQRVNTRATARLGRLAVENGVRRFIYFSSIKVNGETSSRPITAQDPPHAQGAYARSKLRAEQRLKAITKGQRCHYIILRPPLVYGPRVRANFLRLLKLVAADKPLPLGSFHNRRSMIYVNNLVDATICAMENPQAAGRVFTLSDGQDIAVVDLVKALARAMGKTPKLFPFPPKWLYRLFQMVGRGEMVEKLRQPLTVDASQFCKTLDWQPPFTLNQGLIDTVAWFRQSDLAP